MRTLLLLILISSIFSQCYIFRDTWISVKNGSITVSTRKNVQWLGFRLNDVMIRGNGDGFYISPYHQVDKMELLPSTSKPLEFINTYKISYINPNTSNVAIAENTETTNINITHTTKSGSLLPSSFCISSMGLPGKITSINWWSFCFVVIFYICLFFIAVMMSDKEPFKHKFLCFLICIFGELVYSLGDRIENQYTFEWYTINGCYVDSFVIYPSQQLTFVLPLILYFRYLVLLQINLNKIKISEEENIVDNLRWHHKFFHRLTSKYITIFVPIIYVSIFMIVMFIILAANKFTCNASTTTLNQLIFSAFCAGGFVFLLLVDMIRIIPLLLRCKFREYLNNDPHYFRLEHLSIILLVTCFILWAIGVLGKTGNMIVIEIAFFMTLAINGGISLLLTIIFEIYNRLKTRPDENEGEMKLIFSGEDKEFKKMFKEFCQKEWSVENFLCMDQIFKYRNAKLLEERKKIADVVEILHLNDACQYEVNVKDSIKRKAALHIKGGNYQSSIFDDLYVEINKNLQDTYSRFVVSKPYSDRQNRNLLNKSMKDVLKN